MTDAPDTNARPSPARGGLRYRPARANFSTSVPFDHLHRAAERAELAEAALEAGAAVAYEWDFDTDRISWGGSWRAFAGSAAGPGGAPAFGAALQTTLAAGDRQRRYEAMFGTGEADEGDGVGYCLRYRLDGVGEIVEEGRWHTDEAGRPHLARGILKRLQGPPAAAAEGKARSAKSPKRTGAGDEAVLTRAGLTAALGREIGQSVRAGGGAGLLLVGIDRLSMLNRSYGFEVADRLIEAVWHRIRSALPMRYVLGGYTGNKLGIVLPRGDSVPLAEVAGQILAAVNDEPLATAAGLVPATVSVGGVLLPDHGNSAEMAMLRAEEALAAARETAAPGFAAYEPSSKREETRSRNLMLADRIVAGLNDRRFHLHFQPVVAARNAEPAFYECLLRLTEPDGSVTSAGAFMPAAEELGLARLLDHRVLELVLGELERHPKISLSLNVSPLTAVSSDWLGCLQTTIRTRPELAARLIVEITETVAIEDMDAAVHFVATLRAAGCRVAMDDFGAGYTSFRNLKLLDVDMVKIDGEFVKELSDNRDDQVFVRALIDLAGNFGLETVAECVERAEDADLLASWGVGCFQGYYYGRPGPDLPTAAAAEGPDVAVN
jgi:diguanylate cyclase (GGDEF)-like protein